MSQWVKLKPVRHQVAIAGQVTDAETTQAISGARVEITTMPDKFKTWLALHSMQYGSKWEQMVERPDRKRTAVDGFFYFLDLPDGEYILTASLQSAGTRYGQTSTEPITVSRQDGNINASWETGGNLNVVIALQPTAIKGTITDSSNQAVVMAKVQVEGSPEHTFSDSKGCYLLIGLEAPSQRSVNVFVTALGYEFQPCPPQTEITRGCVKTQNFRLVEKAKQQSEASQSRTTSVKKGQEGQGG
jgi:hypothetical protein